MAGKTHRKGKSLIDVSREFATEEACLNYLEALRWPNGVRCEYCGSDRISKFTTKAGTRQRKNPKTGEITTALVPARHLYQCLACKEQFSAINGTIFNDSHLPLQKWMMAVALMVNGKKGISAKQLERDLDVNYRTAWYLEHRIRKAMELGNFADDKLSGTVEMDETYVGGKFDKRRKRAKYDKDPVFGMIERGGDVRAFHINAADSWHITGKILANVHAETELVVTDESKIYDALGARFNHETINHGSKEYVRGNIHTNAIENFWSLFKRRVVGSFHQISIKHLQRYISEFCWRFNNRENEQIFIIVIAQLLYGTPMPYARLTAGPSAKVTRNASAARQNRKRGRPREDSHF